jgi:hypothetical protein
MAAVAMETAKMLKKKRIIIRIITRNDMIWRIINGSQFQKLWRMSIHKNKIYLETKFSTNRGIFVFWRPYGAACLTPCKYPFPLKLETKQGGFKKLLDSFHQTLWNFVGISTVVCGSHFHWNLFIFEFLAIYFDFILAAILKWRPFWKFLNQRAQLWVMIYFCVKFQFLVIIIIPPLLLAAILCDQILRDWWSDLC